MSAKPVLLLDQDGPLADFDLAFWRLGHNLGVTFDIASMKDQTHRFADQHIPDKSARKAMRTIVNETHWFAGLPVTEYADGGVRVLEQHFDVWVCTKPLEANRWCASDKYAWLRKHFPRLADKLIVTPDKSMVQGDILLDDAIKPAWVERAAWTPVTFDAPFNRTGPHAFDLRWKWTDPVERLVEVAKMRGKW